MTRSLRARLVLATALVLAGALGLFWGALYLSFARALRRQFDERLAADARALAGLAELPPDGPWEFDPPVRSASAVAYYEVWTDEGGVLARSPALGTRDLPRTAVGTEAAVTADVVLPDGRPGRRLQVDLAPRQEEPSIPATPRHVTVVVAGPTGELDQTLRLFRYWGGGLGLAVLTAGISAAAIAVRRGLRPLAEIAAEIDRIDERSLALRLPVEAVPAEMRTAVGKLNEALARLEESFARERRFSSDVSHELRTPLAGLRSILEVAASRERDGAAYRAALGEALAVSAQMQRLVEDLLLLARLESGQVPVHPEAVALRGLASQCLGTYAARAEERRLRCENQVPSEATVVSDREKLRLVVCNIIANAVAYTAEGGTVRVNSDPKAGLVLEVWDSGPAVAPADLPRLFERFFRAEASRSGSGESCGIGLSLVRALGDVLGLAVTAENTTDGGVRFRLSGPAA